VPQNWCSSNFGVPTPTNLRNRGVRSLVVLHVIYSPAATRQSYDRRAPRVRFGSGGKQAVKLLYWLRKLRRGLPWSDSLVSRDSRAAHLSHGC
jgi:hypothetical protein